MQLTDEKIKDILRNREKKIQSIHMRMNILYEETTDDAMLKDAALPSSKVYGSISANNGSKRDLADILESVEKRKLHRNKEIREIMWQLSELENEINRVWNCFVALEDPYFTILLSLYVKGEKYEIVEKNFGMSHKSFEKYRSEAMTLLRKYYESDDTAADLIRKKQRNHANGRRANHKPGTNDAYEQLHLKFE